MTLVRSNERETNAGIIFYCRKESGPLQGNARQWRRHIIAVRAEGLLYYGQRSRQESTAEESRFTDQEDATTWLSKPRRDI